MYNNVITTPLMCNISLILIKCIIIAEIQSLNPVWLFATLWIPGFSFLHCRLVSSNSHPLSQWCYLTTSSSVTHFFFCSFFTSIRVFSNEFAFRIRWPKDWSFSFSISPPDEYSGLSSFRIDWLDLLVVQGTLKSLIQHHTSKISIFQCSTFFMVQLSHPYMTTGKTIWLYRPLLAEWFLCFSVCSLGLS